MQQSSVNNNEMLLWPEGAPGALGQEDIDQPKITICLAQPEIATGAAVVICAGGGYEFLSNEYEGRFPAQWLNTLGIAGIFVHYRIAPKYGHPTPMLDITRAMRTVRAHAAEWSIDPERIGIWGFSAGGHLAATAGTHFDAGDPNAVDPIERVSSRPNFMILSYPVITMDEIFTHMGTRENLIGMSPDAELVEFLSHEKHVTSDTPPTFLFHTNEDPVVPAENSVEFYLALRRAGVPAEMHIYQNGRHGLNLAQFDPVADTWPELLKRWIRNF